MARRIFVALPLSPTFQEHVAVWRAGYRNLPVRWLAGKNLHITIIPPWHEEHPEAILDLLQTLEGTIGGFRAEFHRVKYGPNSKEPRLIWADGEAPDQIFTLKHSVERTLSQTPEVSAFRMHVTLARFRPEDFATFPVQEIKDSVSWTDEISSFVVMESHLTPEGADYEILGTFKL